MRKKSLKIITCLFAIAFLFMGGFEVEAKYKTEVVASTDRRGNDPCKFSSYVCIRALSAVRISYYKKTANGTYKLLNSIDFYNKGGNETGWKSKMVNDYWNEKVEKFTTINSSDKKRKSYNFDSFKYIKNTKISNKDVAFNTRILNLTSNKHAIIGTQSSFYSNFIKKMKSGKPDFIAPILHELTNKVSAGADANTLTAYFRKNKHDKLLVEPLFLGQVQSKENARRNANKWSGAVGTSYNVANFVTNKYGCSGDNYKFYCDRSDKGHVTKMANSMYIPKSQNKKNTLSIPGVEPAAKDKTKMNDLKELNGYGSMVVSLKTFIPEPVVVMSKCYLVDGGDNCDDCNEQTINDSNVPVDINNETFINQEKVKINKECNDSSLGKSPGLYSQSSYGVDVGKINNYCHIYCSNSKNFSYKPPTGGNNNFNSIFGTNTKSDFFQTVLEIRGSIEYQCKIDFTYDYSDYSFSRGGKIEDCEEKKVFNASNCDALKKGQEKEYTVIKENKVCSILKRIAGNSSYEVPYVTKAEAELAVAWNRFLNAKLEAQICDTEKYKNKRKEANKAYRAKLKSIREDMQTCGEALDTLQDSVDANIQKPEIYYDNEKMNVVELTDRSVKTCENCAGKKLEIAKNGSSICGGGSCAVAFNCLPDEKSEQEEENAQISAGICGLQRYYQKEISMLPVAVIKVEKYFTSNTKYKYDFNSGFSIKTEEGKKINTDKEAIDIVGKVNSDSKLVCKTNIQGDYKIPGVNGSKVISLTKEFKVKVPKAVCPREGQSTCRNLVKIEAGQTNCACPPSTLHSGENVYNILDRLNALDVENGDFSMTCSDAIRRFCNITSADTGTGYEPVLGKDEAQSIDGCLSYGIPYKVCAESDLSATCTNEYGNKILITSQVWNYISQHKEYLTRLEDPNITIKQREKIFADAASKASKGILKCSCGSKDGPVYDYQYRTIKLGNKTEAFPGIKGRGRVPGWNWRSDLDIDQYITDTKDVYNKEPMYSIKLSPATVRNIRKYNRSTDYGDFNLDCKGGSSGASCLSSFLHHSGLVTVKGKCANAGKINFYECVNH